jgi:hypothetical protein
MSNFNRIPQLVGMSSPPPSLPSPAAWLRHHPSQWQPGTIDVAALSAASEALYRSPGFEQDIHRFAHCWQEGYDSSPVLNSVMRNNARYVLLLACLWLDHVRDPAQPEVSITPTRMLNFYERIDRQLVVGGTSRIKSILGHVRSAGLLQPAKVGGDARRRPLEPTAALRNAMAGYVAGFLRGIPPVLALPADPQAMVQTPGFVGELFTYRLAGLLHDRFSINQGLSAMTWITNREKGYALLLVLLRTLQLQPDGTAQTSGVPQQMADIVGLSRGTARNFLLGCVEQGWIVGAADHAWILQPEFTSQLLQWMGREFLWMHTLACAAWDITLQQRDAAAFSLPGSPFPAARTSTAAAHPGS